MYSTRLIWFYDVKDQIRWTYEDIFFTDESECRLEKGLVGLLCGLLLGTATFLAFAYVLEFEFFTSAIVGGVTGLILAILLAFNTHLRAVVCLCMPTLTLKSGRLIVSTIIFSLLLAGPITNFSNNVTELASTHACSGELLYNQSLAIQRRIKEPFDRYWAGVKAKVAELDKPIKGVNKLWDGVKNLILNIGFKHIKKIRDEFNKVSGKLTLGFEMDNYIEADVDAIPTREELVQKIKDDISGQVEIIDIILLYVNRAISLSVLIIVIQSVFYLKKYNQSNVDFTDNQYITQQFVQLDEEKKQEGQSLLPLTPTERLLVTDKRQKSMSSLERKALCACLIPLFITIIGGLIIIAGDVVLYESIRFVIEHNNYRVAVNSQGDIKVFKMDEVQTEVFDDLINDKAINTARCLPKGSPPNKNYYIGLGVAYIVYILMVTFQAYMLRLRRLIASYFYPQAETKKIEALHRKLVQERTLTLLRIQDDLVAKKQRRAKKDYASPATLVAIKKGVASFKSSKWWLIKKKCYICQTEGAKNKKPTKCDSCGQCICQDCMDTLIRSPICPCMEERRLPYDDVTESDFAGLTRRKTFDSETFV